MIEFKGKLSGAAEQYYISKSSWSEQLTLLIVFAASFPTSFWIGCKILAIPLFKLRGLLIVYSLFLLLIYIMPKLPRSAKNKRKYMPKRIYTEEDYILLVSDKHTDSKLIEHVKVVYDCGEYYDIRFPFGHYTSVPLICQKDLIVKGSLEEFEALFEGKIVRK